MKTTIDGKEYTVERVFNMVANYEFTDKDGKVYLVDAEDIQVWRDDEDAEYTNSLDLAIRYAKYWAENSEDGTFWWKVKGE